MNMWCEFLFLYFFLRAGLLQTQQDVPLFPQEDERIVGGEIIDITNASYQVSVQYKSNKKTFSHICGGSIICKNWILTAAHCFIEDVNPENFCVKVGCTSRNDENCQNIKVKNVICHENFDLDTMRYDIALLNLKENIKSSNKTKSISLTPTDSKCKVGSTATVSGYGKNKTEDNVYLQKTNVSIVSKETCQTAYEDQDLEISDDMLCAGYKNGGKDACQGDSGGPLVQNDMQVGIVSWGLGCGEPGFYGVYTSVAFFRNWIKEKTGV